MVKKTKTKQKVGEREPKVVNFSLSSFLNTCKLLVVGIGVVLRCVIQVTVSKVSDGYLRDLIY